MSIEPITSDEFESIYKNRGGGRRLCTESQAARALKLGTGIKFPCRWRHSHSYQCHGYSTFGRRRVGFKIFAACKDGIFYLFRPFEAADNIALSNPKEEKP